MSDLALSNVRITGGYWGGRLAMNARTAIHHQWDQLVATGCINNFRLAAGQGTGFREGYFFADSDAYKWLDAAARILATAPDATLQARVDELIDLIAAAQLPDGYLFTYNQLHFPGQRWTNLQVEHELYCLGHLIEAGIAHQQAIGSQRLLVICTRVADLLVRDFMAAGPAATDGHEEIELALLRLHHLTGAPAYLELARRFLERRGRSRGYGLRMVREGLSTLLRLRTRDRQHAAYRQSHPEQPALCLPASNPHKSFRFMAVRSLHNTLTGKATQQHAPLRAQTVPVGHAVRFAYLETAVTMLQRATGDSTLEPALIQAWEHMVTRRMSVTGGVGALPLIEGFGRDYELDPELMYAETCAALGCMFWNRELALLTGAARYDDLFEWQLYNAAGAGMGADGRSYLYNNPLACRGDLTRAPWYLVPCCPSNLSRTWAALGAYLYSARAGNLRIHQYADSVAELDVGVPVRLRLETGLPWAGRVHVTLEPAVAHEFSVDFRLPAWAGGCRVQVNGSDQEPRAVERSRPMPPTACGYSPNGASWLRLARRWQPGDTVAIDFAMPVRYYRQHPRVPRCGGQAAIARGPLVYCLESSDQPDLDLFGLTLGAEAVRPVCSTALPGDGAVVLQATARSGAPLTFIPYMLWANRGPAQMNVFVGI